MTDFFGYMKATEVKDARTYANFIQQELGTPYPSTKTLPMLSRNCKDFFEQYPQANWMTLVRVVEFCRARKKRPAHAHGVLGQVRYAYSAGFLPELSPRDQVDSDLEERIAEALQSEQDEQWRHRLLASSGIEARRQVYVAWRDDRALHG